MVKILLLYFSYLRQYYKCSQSRPSNDGRVSDPTPERSAIWCKNCWWLDSENVLNPTPKCSTIKRFLGRPIVHTLIQSWVRHSKSAILRSNYCVIWLKRICRIDKYVENVTVGISHILTSGGSFWDVVFGQYIQQRRLIALNLAKDNEEQNIQTWIRRPEPEWLEDWKLFYPDGLCSTEANRTTYILQ